jgi:hypothetical protein
VAISYHVYANDMAGGSIDYGSPVATVVGTTWATPPIPLGSDARYAVRAFDTVSGLIDQNVDAAVRILTDPTTGADVTARPNPPIGLSVLPTANGGVTIRWTYNPGGATAPQSFDVYLTAGTAVDWTAPPATSVPYVPGQPAYSANLTGLTGGTTYAVGVRGRNAAGREVNTTTVTFAAKTTGPAAVEGATAVVVP